MPRVETIRPVCLALGLLVSTAGSANALDVAVSFDVDNVNRSLVPCLSDQGTYTVSGRLVTPESVPAGVTLYAHGLGFGEFFWSFPGQDFAAAMADAGHASVVIDRIGYDETGHPNGVLSCLGAQADVLNQIVDQLRAGSYSVDGDTEPVAFSKVALAGHSAGGAIAQIAAYSFDNVDALAVLAYADQGASNAALSAFAETAVACLTGGEEAEPGEPSGYAAFGQTDEDFRSLMFHDAEPGVVEQTTALRNLDPCGDDGSLPTEIVMSTVLLRTVSVPTLLVCGEEDAIFPPPACDQQADHFTGTPDFTFVSLPDIGHALTLEREAPAFRTALSDWLAERGF